MERTDTRRPAEQFPPGEFISDELEARGWAQADLAAILGRPVQAINEIIAGKKAITPETAKELEAAFGIDAQYWMNLETSYRLWLIDEKPAAVSQRAKLYSKAPVRAMIKRGWIDESKNPAILERRVLAFLEQKSIDDESEFDHAARKSTAYRMTTPEQFAWLCRARQLARALSPNRAWRPSRTGDLVAELRRLTLSAPAIRDVPQVLSDFGIRLVVVERLPGMKMDGATFWLGASEPVVALALRFDRIDNAWHTLMHEIGHVAHNDRLAVDEEILQSGDKPEAEKRADEFAVGALVPQDRLDDFCNRVAPMFSRVRLLGFASILQVHPGIIVGQLHHRGSERRGLHHKYFRKFLSPVRAYLTETALTDGWDKTVRVEPEN